MAEIYKMSVLNYVSLTIILLTWDKCPPIRSDDVASGEIFTTHTDVCRLIMADHDDSI